MQSGGSNQKEEILSRLKKLEDEVNALKTFVTTGKMGEISEDSTTADQEEKPAGKNENLIEIEKLELLQKPEIKGLFDRIDSYLSS